MFAIFGLGPMELIILALPVAGGIFFLIYWLMGSGKGGDE